MEKLTCNSLRKTDAGKKIALDGWVHTIRDHGDTFFIDLRDREGITQLVAKRENVPEEVFDKLNAVTRESVIQVEGNVKERPPGTENEDLDTGEIEIEVNNIKILNMCQQLPYHWKDYDKASPEVRLKYRYIDLRAPNLYKNMRIRSQVTTETYKFLQEKGFIHVETPMLTKSTPEGARDYLVPSRVHKGKFYALPQSPQLFKQLLMVAGLQRYFQITRCFRDEDLRNDRQPEFTQLDIEMSFITQEDIISLIEEYLVYIFETVLDVKIERPFPRFTYEEAMGQYGTDKPDIRFGLKLVDITDLIPENTEIFKDVFAEGGIISALKVEGYGDISRKKFEKYRRYVRIFKAQDVGNILLRENEIKTPLGRYVGDSVIDAIVERTEAKQGDLICFIGGEKSIVYRALGELRLKIAEDLDLIPENEFKFLWVVDFPLFEWDEDENRWTAMHHPFTSCKKEYLDIFDENPGDALANAYDVVLNGYELGGGSIRNHDPDVQERMFKALDIPPEIAKSNFSFLIEALKYGAPPHGGIALGFDRLIMLMVQEETLRDVIAFPKNRNAILPVGNAPDRVTNEQLDTLGIDLTPEVRAQLEKEEENDS